ncbi:MAG: hypothetical protein CMK44_07915 [Porticoccus sp.]|jgi:hypothetical protein|nr:hypothetical protein [Porticoccus sp.]|tara:strand:- start:585 stop:881 length:297 start_codon:yes stop_codon:yes gene_type:complete
MAILKDKEKVLGEVFDDERIKTFLNFLPPKNINQDFHLLEKAYRGMNIENFETFIKFFLEDGRDINAHNPSGKSFTAIVNEHIKGKSYAAIMQRYGGS